jgi:hypothetical protein
MSDEDPRVAQSRDAMYAAAHAVIAATETLEAAEAALRVVTEAHRLLKVRTALKEAAEAHHAATLEGRVETRLAFDRAFMALAFEVVPGTLCDEIGALCTDAPAHLHELPHSILSVCGEIANFRAIARDGVLDLSTPAQTGKVESADWAA